MVQNANGQAATAIAPDHGSNIPQQETKMNTSEHSTGPAAAPAPKELEQLFETGLDKAARLASILETLLGNALEKDVSSIVGPLGNQCYNIIQHERENLFFVAYQISDEIAKVQSAFEEAAR